jgi:protein-tyrosine phosphatase
MEQAAGAGALPFNFSWVNAELAASAHPGYRPEELEATLAAVTAEGIGCVVSLAPISAPAVAAAGLVHIGLAVPDMGVPEFGELADAIAGARRQLAHGKKILVHCGAGYGRTGLFLACFLVSQGMNAQAAIDLVRRKRPGSIETRLQEEFVHRWQQWQAARDRT